MARVAVVIADGFEDREFDQPRAALEAAGQDVSVIGVAAGARLVGKARQVEVTVDAGIADVESADFDALLIPGGHSPDALRKHDQVVAFVRESAEQDMPIAAICHGGVLLAEADVVRGRTVTSWPSVRRELEEAGANWVARDVAVDGNLISSRKPADLDAFIRALLTATAD